MRRETIGEVAVAVGLMLAGYGMWLALGLPALMGYAGAVLVVFGVMLALTTPGRRDDS